MEAIYGLACALLSDTLFVRCVHIMIVLECYVASPLLIMMRLVISVFIPLRGYILSTSQCAPTRYACEKKEGTL